MNRSMTALGVGTLGENILREHLLEQDYQVFEPQTRQSGDLIVFDDLGSEIKIEVKTARRCKDGSWHFKLRKKDKFGGTSISHSDILCLLLIHKISIDLFVIPVDFFPSKQQSFSMRHRASEYHGRLKPFLQDIRRIDIFKFQNDCSIC